MEQNLVDGQGWISSDSSFYGDDEQKAGWMDSPRPRRDPVKRSRPNKSLVVTSEQGWKGRAGRYMEGSSPLVQNGISSLDLPSIPTTDNAGFSLSSRRAFRQLGHDSSNGSFGKSASEDASLPKGREAVWQQTEIIDEFLARLPVRDPATASVGPWLWVRNPKLPFELNHGAEAANIRALMKAGLDLLAAFESKRKDQKVFQLKATKTSTLQHSDLQGSVLALATQTGVTCGKWMLFPSMSDLPKAWASVAKATAAGRLGPCAKVGTCSAGDRNSLICVYTYDFSDVKDIRRVLNALLKLNLVSTNGKPIYYKCDAYTYLGIDSKNPYKLRASLHSSKDFL